MRALALTELDNYYCLDARKLHRIVAPNSVQTTVTSPPYFDVKNYGRNSHQIGWNQGYDEYLSDLRDVFQQCFEATTDTGTLWVVVDTYKRQGHLKLLPFDLTKVLEEIHWIPQDVIVWDKVKNLPYSARGQFRNNFEYILLLSKTEDFKYYIDRIREVETLSKWWVKYPERYNPKGKVPENIWRIAIPNQGAWSNGFIQHLCPFPPELVERIVLLSTDENDLVLDPFAGSGIVLAQTKCMKRRFIGCDIYEEYRARFYSKVLPEVEKRYRQREKVLNSNQIMQKEFSNLIHSLRKLKFGKIILKKLVTRFGRSDFRLIVLDSKDKGKDASTSFTLVLTVAEDLIREEVERWLFEQIRLKPLSGFGLCPTIRVIEDKEIAEYIKGTNYAVYLGGRFYEKARDTDINTALKAVDYKFPLMISDIRVSREIAKNSSLSYPND